MQKADILVVGSGIGGLFFAMRIADKRPDLTIVIMTKEKASDTNTRLAQGGIAVVTNFLNDSFDQHIQDTLQSGAGHCNAQIVEMVINQAPYRLKELLDIGTDFDKTKSGEWDLGLEGGHSQHRILHHKDTSGFEIESKLLEHISLFPNVKLLEDHWVIDLTTEKKAGATICTGAFFYNKKKGWTRFITARTIVLSTGGCGQVFENTTNPEIATGDGIAMALRAGATVQEMQFIQFHPTALYQENKNPFFLISEAVRGFGAYVVNEEQKRFLFKYDIRGELATRDVVTQAIHNEMQLSEKKHVYLDCRHLDPESFYNHFPSISAYCEKIGLYPAHDLIPIVPVAHYQCGGISVNENAVTNIPNLYAVGECSRTGLHGKNRLASNSLLEALVFAHQAAKNIDKTIEKFFFSSRFFIAKYNDVILDKNDGVSSLLKKELQKLMTLFYNTEEPNFTTTANKLETMKTTAHECMKKDRISLSLIELTNMLTVALIIIEHRSKSTLHRI